MPEHLVHPVGERMVIRDPNGQIEGNIQQFEDEAIVSDALENLLLEPNRPVIAKLIA